METQDLQDHLHFLNRRLRSEIFSQIGCQPSYQRLTWTLKDHYRLGRLPLLQNITKMKLWGDIDRCIHVWICNTRTYQVQPSCPKKSTTCSPYMGRTSLQSTMTTIPRKIIQCSITWQIRHSSLTWHIRHIPILQACRQPLHLTSIE